MKNLFAWCAAGILAGMPLFAQELNPLADAEGHIKAIGRGNWSRNNPAPKQAGTAVVTGNGINYNGGPVMPGTTHVYYIYYGDWSKDSTGPAILERYPSLVGGSPYFNINTTYSDNNGNTVANSVILMGKATSDYTATNPTNLTDNDIWGIVTRAFTTTNSAAKVPVDSSGVYFVLTAPGVGESSGFLTQYCGWHTYGTYGGQNIKFSFVGNAAGPSLGNCAAQTSSSPNNDPGADAMVSVIAHELEETVTDPLLNAWYDSRGYENADKCAWTFQPTYTAANGSLANINLGGYDFLIQRNWVNAGGGYCSMSYNSTPDFSLSVSPSSQTVTQGGTTAAYGINVSPSNGYSNSVTLSTSGLPSGATPQFTVNPVAGGSGSSSLTVAVGSTVAPGTYNFTIKGTDGTITHTVSATLAVKSAGDFTISVSPSSLTVKRGTSGQYTVTVTASGGFNSSVQLGVSGLPPRTGGSFYPNPVTTYDATGKGTSTFTVNVQTRANTTRGRTLTFTGTGGGISHTATATLTIN